MSTSLPRIASHEEWLAARKELLAKEKELTRARDALSAQRRHLPMVEMTEPYAFEGPDGTVGLADLFEGRSQQIGGSYYLLDLTALGRQEDWEDPKGRAHALRSATPGFDA